MANLFGVRSTRNVDLGVGVISLALGTVCFLHSSGHHGFVRGLFQGAGISTALIGLYLLGYAIHGFATGTSRTLDGTVDRAPGITADEMWLPSRDN